MTGNDVYDVLKHASRAIMSTNSALRIRLDDREPLGRGSTDPIDANGNVFIDVGVGGLKGNHNEISDGAAAVAIVAAFHEGCGHGFQWLYEFEKDTPLSKALVSNCLACLFSERYLGYDDDRNLTDAYFRQPHEVAAQYSGLIHARSFLKGMYGPERADELVVACESWRRNDGSSYLQDDADISSADSIMKAYEKRFKDVLHAHRRYVPAPNDIRCSFVDAIADFKDCNPKYDIDGLVMNFRDGMMQDLRVAAVGRWSVARNPIALDTLFGNRAAGSLGIVDDVGLKAVMRSDAKPFHTWPEPLSMRLVKLHQEKQKMEQFGRDPPKQDVPGFE